MKTILYALCFSLASLAPAQVEAPTTQAAPMPQLNFHESWSAEERAALAEYVRFLYADAPTALNKYFSKGMGGLEPEALQEEIDEILLHFLAPHQELILRVISSGDANLHTASKHKEWDSIGAVYDETAAITALRFAYYDIVKILVLHGCDPNHHSQTEFGAGDHLFSILLSGTILIADAEKPVQERLELAEWLLEHGADINAPCSLGLGTLGTCLFTLFTQDELPYLDWALDHGLKHQYQGSPDSERRRHPCMILFYVGKDKMLPLVKRLHETGNLPLNDLSWGETPLQGLCSSMSENYKDREQILLYLLEQGADPNLIGVSDPNDEYDEKLSPLQYLEREEAEDEAYAAHIERMKTILLQHGAKQTE